MHKLNPRIHILDRQIVFCGGCIITAKITDWVFLKFLFSWKVFVVCSKKTRFEDFQNKRKVGQKKKARTINIKVVVEARLAGSSSEAKQCRQRRLGILVRQSGNFSWQRD